MNRYAENFLKLNFAKIKLLKKNLRGEVWLAENKSTGELVVIKSVNFSGLPYAKLKKISHKLWAKIFYCAEDDFSTVIVEEFIQGENLAERKNFLTDEVARKIILQLCDGLKILHENNIIHRDIKPSNLILQNETVVRLIDFDAARFFSADKNTDTNFFGTKGYAPPEQFGFGQTDPRSDIFSLGVTMLELLGKNCSSSLKKILSKCVELDPKNRFQSAEDLKFALLEKKSQPYKKIFASIFLASAGIFLFQTQTVEEKNFAPEIVEEKIFDKKISEPENLPAENVEEKIFQFPEIKIPDQNISPEKISEKNIPAEKNSDKKISAEKNSDKKISAEKNFVRVICYVNGEQVGTNVENKIERDFAIGQAIFIPESDWKNFSRVGGEIFLPNWILEIKAKNFSANVLKNPQAEIFYLEGSNVEKKILRGENIPSGGEINFKMPLNNFKIKIPEKNLQFQSILKIKFTGSGAEIFGKTVEIHFVFGEKGNNLPAKKYPMLL